jgi:hypothetical protein
MKVGEGGEKGREGVEDCNRGRDGKEEGENRDRMVGRSHHT